MAIAVAALSLSFEGACCSTSYGASTGWIKSPLDVRRIPDFGSIRNLLFGSTEFHWLPKGHDLCLSKVSVAADYSDSVPDSSSDLNNRGYHPLEDLKGRERVRETELTFAQIARTTVEANSNALLLFPASVHCEPHEQTSWAEFEYVADEYGDLYFQISDNENILEDRGASNPVNALIGMDASMYKNRRMIGEHEILESGTNEEIPFDYDYFEVVESDVSNIPVHWGMPDASSVVHPIYLAKCLNKVVNMEYLKKMDHLSNGVSIFGCLRPASIDEESYLRRIFYYEEGDGYNSDWKDFETLSFESSSSRSSLGSTIYKLEIMRIELFTVYGIQSEVTLQDFQDAEPDILVNSTSAILEHFSEKGISFDAALKALCKKKGLQVEGAILIGVDSLGIDVRVFSGTEVRTHRFPFKMRATSELAAEKQIQQLLFPRSRRRKLRSHADGLEHSIGE